MPDNQKVSFHFQPNNFDNMGHIVEKEENGKKKRYLEGVASGLKRDAHGERMTEKCIKSFMDQANSGDVLLYPDIHGIKASEDIGILKEAKILPNGDWWISNKLYDEDDNIGPNKFEVITTIWKQMCGLPPYTKPKQKGYSIEGYMPPDGILSGEPDQFGNIRKRVMDNIHLDGVILVPRPAYKDSIASAVFKALGEIPPEFENNLRKSIKEELQNRIEEQDLRDKYYSKKWDIQDALESQVERIMQREKDERKRNQLEILFDEFSNLYIDLIMESEGLFLTETNNGDDSVASPYGVTKVAKSAKLELFESLYRQVKQLENSITQRR